MLNFLSHSSSNYFSCLISYTFVLGLIFFFDRNLHYSLNASFFLTIVCVTSSFHHHMFPRSLLDFFSHTLSPFFRTPSLKVFHTTVLSYLLFLFFKSYSCLVLLQPPQIFCLHILLLLMIRSFLTIFFKTVSSRSTTTNLR